eukprot:Em0145g15a
MQYGFDVSLAFVAIGKPTLVRLILCVGVSGTNAKDPARVSRAFSTEVVHNVSKPALGPRRVSRFSILVACASRATILVDAFVILDFGCALKLNLRGFCWEQERLCEGKGVEDLLNERYCPSMNGLRPLLANWSWVVELRIEGLIELNSSREIETRGHS